MVFCLVMKVYHGATCRSLPNYLHDYIDQRFLSRVPGKTSPQDRLGNPALGQLLQGLVEDSSKPIAAFDEIDFAVDSTGFSASPYERYFEAKKQRLHTEGTWVKAHAMVGVGTHIVTAVSVTPRGDATQLPDLLATTTKSFKNVQAVSADKAYLSKRNLEVIEAAGAVPYIPFKANSICAGSERWNRAWYMFHCRQDEFRARYHKRSNVETVFAMVKRRFGSHVLAKRGQAQTSEVLAKFLAHNLCVQVQTMCELGIPIETWLDWNADLTRIPLLTLCAS